MSGDGVRRADLSPCAACGEPLVRQGDRTHLDAYRIRLDTLIFDQGVLQRHAGLTVMLGGHEGLAHVMGLDEEFFKRLDTHEGLICSPCALSHPLLVLRELMEKRAQERSEEKEIEASGGAR